MSAPMAFKPFIEQGTYRKRMCSVLRYLERKPRSSLNIVDYVYREFGIKPKAASQMVKEMAQSQFIKNIGDKIEITDLGKKMLEIHWDI